MIEKILIILLTLIYLGAFITRNLIVKADTKQRIRASDFLLKSSIIFTTLCFLMTIISTNSERWYQLMGAIVFLRYPIISYMGLFLFALSIIMGWSFSAQLKNSWRVGIHENQKTALIQNGIYAYIRNPYFLSYFIMFFSLFLVRPSYVLFVLLLAASTIFHCMVIREEIHLLNLHGKEYIKYKKKTGRYIPRFIK